MDRAQALGAEGREGDPVDLVDERLERRCRGDQATVIPHGGLCSLKCFQALRRARDPSFDLPTTTAFGPISHINSAVDACLGEGLADV